MLVFNDFRHTDEDAGDGKKHFYFEDIDLGSGHTPLNYRRMLETEGKEKTNKLLANTERKNKLSFYQEDFSIKAGEKRDLKFKIHSEYEQTDRLIWAFQEISNNVKVIINLMYGKIEDLDNKFLLTISHPLEEDILRRNPNIRENGEIIFNGEMKRKGDFILDETLLPYQGFEISWDIKHRKETNDV